MIMLKSLIYTLLLIFSYLLIKDLYFLLTNCYCTFMLTKNGKTFDWEKVNSALGSNKVKQWLCTHFIFNVVLKELRCSKVKTFNKDNVNYFETCIPCGFSFIITHREGLHRCVLKLEGKDLINFPTHYVGYWIGFILLQNPDADTFIKKSYSPWE